MHKTTLLLAVFLLALAGGQLLAEGAGDASLGKKIADFALSDPRDQRRVSLGELKEKKAIVVIFLGTECPVNNAFLPTLAALHKEYAGKGAEFLAINSNVQDTLERTANHAKKNAIPFPVLKDAGNKIADQFGVRRTPEAFVLDSSHTIVYHGRIDDQFGVGYQRPKPTRRDLAVAIDEVLSGKKVTLASTEVSGCILGRAGELKADGAVTYSKQISRLVQKNCQECHRPNHIGPMALLTYDDVAAWSGMIREVVSDKRMPPWHADPRFGHFANNRSLPKEDRDMLLAWIDQGCPKGDKKDLPEPRQFVEGWRIGQPDMVVSMPSEFTVPATVSGNGVPYKYFTVDPGFKEDRWIERAEAKAGAADVVHHIIVFISPPGEKPMPGGAGAGRRGMRLLVGTAPGDMPLILEPGQAKKVPAGSSLIFQMHYTPNGKEQKDKSCVGLVFAKEPPRYQVLTVGVSNQRLSIPAGADAHPVESEFTLPEDGHLISFMPHMHLRGKDFLYELVGPDGKKETLLSIPRYDFNWQSVYRIATPVAFAKGSKVHCLAHFDNSENNLNNPDPKKLVTWGDQTWEEMMIGWIDFYFDKPAK
jgi:peroxiredoxin